MLQFKYDFTLRPRYASFPRTNYLFFSLFVNKHGVKYLPWQLLKFGRDLLDHIDERCILINLTLLYSNHYNITNNNKLSLFYARKCM